MIVRATRDFTDKKKDGMRWRGDEFEVTPARAKELLKHGVVEAVSEEGEDDENGDSSKDEKGDSAEE